jgi:hypothetical protein
MAAATGGWRHPELMRRDDDLQDEMSLAAMAAQNRQNSRLISGTRLKHFLAIPPSTFDGKSPKLDQARLLRMPFQSELSQPFP